MTSKQLEALLIDQALGELSEEAAALLDHYLERNPDQAEFAVQVRGAVGVSSAAVAMRPLVVAAAPAAPRALPDGLRRVAVLAFLALALGGAFFAGRGTRPTESPAPAIAESDERETPSPWARYRIGENGQLSVILPSGSKS